MPDKQKVLAGRNRVDAYRTAHAAMHNATWSKDVPAAHTPLITSMVSALKGLGFTSNETDFEKEKNDALAMFWDASNLLNVQELGFADMEDFIAKATDEELRACAEMWH